MDLNEKSMSKVFKYTPLWNPNKLFTYSWKSYTFALKDPAPFKSTVFPRTPDIL